MTLSRRSAHGAAGLDTEPGTIPGIVPGPRRGRRRAAVASTSVAVLASSTLLALGTGPTSYAAPPQDCAEAFPVTDVVGATRSTA